MSLKKISLQSPPPNIAEQLFGVAVLELSPVQETAMQLYTLGLNVFPLPYGKKGGYPWGMLQYTRLLAEHLYPLFRDRCNIAVMSGRTSGNLFVIDCESAASFSYHERLLRKAHIPLWAVRSNGKRNGGHFYLRCSDGEVKNVRAGERKDVEIRGNRCYVLAPPSLHPYTGRLYQWHERETPDPPAVSIDQVHWLGLTLTRDSPPKTMPLPFIELSSATREFLLNGATHGERNNRLFAAACDLAGCDYDQNASLQLLLPIAYKSGLPEREARDTINSAYSKPRRAAKPTAYAQNRPSAWQIALAWAENQQWKDRTGQTDRAVFLACCERAKTANETGLFRASAREIAELARITPNTASTSLKRLTGARFIVYCGVDNGSKAHLYRLGFVTQKVDLVRYQYTITLSSGDDSVSVTQPFGSDAAERGALNKTAAVLYDAMVALTLPTRNRDLMELTKLSKYQIIRALKRLQAFGLVQQIGQGWQAVPMTNEELDDRVARPAGTLGKGEQRALTHQRERAKRAGERLYRARFGSGHFPIS